MQSKEVMNTVGDNVAEGLLKSVLHYKFPAFTALLVDILSILVTLSRSLQALSSSSWALFNQQWVDLKGSMS